MLGQKVEKDADCGGEVVALRVDGVDVGGAADPGLENPCQLAGAQVAGDVPFRAQHDAVAGERPVDGDFSVVGRLARPSAAPGRP